MWRPNNIPQNDYCVKEEVKRETKMTVNKWKWRYLLQEPWHIAKVALTGKYVAIQKHIQKKEILQINNLTPEGTITRILNKIQ